jgi:hypothetical protein
LKGAPRDSRHGCVRQRQHGQYLFVGNQEGLLGNLEPIGSFEIEPRVGRYLPGEILLDGAVEEHVGGERLSLQGSQGEPPRLDHRRPLEPPALGFIVAPDHHRKLVRQGHLEQGRRKTGAEFVGHVTRGDQGHSLELLDPWNEKVAGQDKRHADTFASDLGIQRIVCEIADIVLAAEEDPAAVMMPMTELMRQGEPPAAFRAATVDGDHRLAHRSQDPRLATVTERVSSGHHSPMRPKKLECRLDFEDGDDGARDGRAS